MGLRVGLSYDRKPRTPSLPSVWITGGNGMVILRTKGDMAIVLDRGGASTFTQGDSVNISGYTLTPYDGTVTLTNEE